MELAIGQQVTYPGQGVCLIEESTHRVVGQNTVEFYSLRVLHDNSTILVPTENALAVGIRPIITPARAKKLMKSLTDDFEDVSGDWKIRSRECGEKLQTGNIFEAADVLKKMTFLSRDKKLSFREQNMLEKAKFLIVSEIANVCQREEAQIEAKITNLIESACEKHISAQTELAAAIC